jgi:hypothetical protein
MRPTERNIYELKKIWISENEKAVTAFEYLPFTDVDSLAGNEISDTAGIHYAIAEKEKMIEILKNDPGIKISANITQNFQPSNDEWEVSGTYRRKYQAGIDWDILNNGFFENKSKIQVYQQDIITLKQNFGNSFSALQSVIIKNSVTAQFIAAQIKILNQSRNVLMKMMAPAKFLELSNDFPRDEYLKLMSRRDEVNSQLNVLNSQNKFFPSANDSVGEKLMCLPVCDLNYDILDGAFEKKYWDSLSIAEQSIQENQKKLMNQISLRPFVKYNLYESATGYPMRNFFSAGVSFSMPLPTNMKKNRELIQIQALKSKSESTDVLISRKTHFDKLIFKYQDQLIRYLDNIQTLKELTEKYRLQRTALKTDSLLFNPFDGLKTLDDIYQQKLHMLLIHEELYMLAISIYRMTSLKSFSGIFKPLDMKNYSGEKDEPDLSVYIWSSTYKNYSLSFVEEYLISNNIKTAMVSLGNDKSIAEKSNQSIVRLHKLGIKTQLLIGDNKLLDKDIYNYLQQKVPNNLKNIILGIHLDVEPQTFDDWTGRKNYYLEKYVKMLKRARQYCDSNKLELYVSIPLSFPDEYLQPIFDLCDKVYLMAYEHPDLDYIRRKSAAEFAAGSNKIVMAYRFKDFKSKIDLYNFIDESKTKLKINRFALHDFSSMTAADKALLKTN